MTETCEASEVFSDKSAWYATLDGENYVVGPCVTREELRGKLEEWSDPLPLLTGAMYRPLREQWQIAFCTHKAIRLSDHFDAENWLAGVEEKDDVCEMGDPRIGGDTFSVTKEQRADLEQCVRAAMDYWQRAHGLRFHSYYFDKIEKQEGDPCP